MRDQAILIYDGDCSFCKFWINRWKPSTQHVVEYRPYQEVPEGFFGISRRQFQRAVQLITPDHQHYSGARAVFELLKLGGNPTWQQFYLRVPLADRLSEFGYRIVARNRNFFYKVTKLFYRGL